MEKFYENRKVEKSELHQLFSQEDFDKVMNWLKKHDQYTLMYVKLMYYTCARPSELRLLRIKYIDIENSKITFPASISKNKRTETVHMDEALKGELLNINLTKFDPNFYLTGSIKEIVGEKPQPEKTTYNRLQKCFEELKIQNKGYTLYSFKHYSNVMRYRNGWSIEEIMISNRHSSLSHTEIYLRDLMKDVSLTKSVPVI